MTEYIDLDGDLSIFMYEIREDGLVVIFRTGEKYLYTYESNRNYIIQDMRECALTGRYLRRFIHNYRPNFDKYELIMSLSTNLKDKIENKINELSLISINNKALILTETDLQCQLYNKLNEIKELSELSQTDDGFMTNKIHTEISWFSDNNNDRLSIRPDITLLNSESLRITSRFDGTPLP